MAGDLNGEGRRVDWNRSADDGEEGQDCREVVASAHSGDNSVGGGEK